MMPPCLLRLTRYPCCTPAPTPAGRRRGGNDEAADSAGAGGLCRGGGGRDAAAGLPLRVLHHRAGRRCDGRRLAVRQAALCVHLSAVQRTAWRSGFYCRRGVVASQCKCPLLFTALSVHRSCPQPQLAAAHPASRQAATGVRPQQAAPLAHTRLPSGWLSGSPGAGTAPGLLATAAPAVGFTTELGRRYSSGRHPPGVQRVVEAMAWQEGVAMLNSPVSAVKGEGGHSCGACCVRLGLRGIQ